MYTRFDFVPDSVTVTVTEKERKIRRGDFDSGPTRVYFYSYRATDKRHLKANLTQNSASRGGINPNLPLRFHIARFRVPMFQSSLFNKDITNYAVPRWDLSNIYAFIK